MAILAYLKVKSGIQLDEILQDKGQPRRNAKGNFPTRLQ